MPARTRAFLIIDSTFPTTEVTGVNKATWGFLQLHKKNPEFLLADGRNGAAVEARTSCAARPARDTKVSRQRGQTGTEGSQESDLFIVVSSYYLMLCFRDRVSLYFRLALNFLCIQR